MPRCPMAKKAKKGKAKDRAGRDDGAKNTAARGNPREVSPPKSPESKPTPAAAVRPVESASFTEALRVGEGFSLFDLDPRSTPAFDGDKAAAKAAMPELADGASELQERLRRVQERRRPVTAAGDPGHGHLRQGGIMRHVVGEFDPQGVSYTSFKAPTAEERKHPFLWRIRRALPAPGQIGVFDRSHYEDVLIARVRELVPRSTWSRRYAQINAFESPSRSPGQPWSR